MADETGDDPTAGTDAHEQVNDERAADGQTVDERAADDRDGAVPAGTVELLAYLDAKYGDRFDTERRDELRERVAGFQEAGETLSEAGLENGDEPAFSFAAYRGEE